MNYFKKSVPVMNGKFKLLDKDDHIIESGDTFKEVRHKGRKYKNQAKELRIKQPNEKYISFCKGEINPKRLYEPENHKVERGV